MFTGVAVLAGILGGEGGIRHSIYLSKEQRIYLTRDFYIAQAFHLLAIGAGKLAIGFLLLRLFGAASIWRRYLIWVLMAIQTIFTILSVIFSFVQCENPAALWDPYLLPATYCWDPEVQSRFTIFYGSLSAAVDFVFALLPISFIWKLHMSARKKAGIAVLLGGGVLSGICAAIKTNKLTTLTVRSDLLWSIFELYTWSGTEICLIIMCGCVPAIKLLWDRFFGQKSQAMSEGTPPQSDASRGRLASLFKSPKRDKFELTSLNDSLQNISHPVDAKAFSSHNTSVRPEVFEDATSSNKPSDLEGGIQISNSFRVDWSERV